MKVEVLENIARELRKNEELVENLVLKILNSKRLLMDHVEALEECLEIAKHALVDSDGKVINKDMKNAINNKLATKEYFTGCNTCLLLGSTLLERMFIPSSLVWIPSMVLTTGVGTLYVLKKVFIFRNKLVELQLEKLINSIDTFANSVRRNMTYFNEIIVMKKQQELEVGQIERAWDCITSTKEVTFLLYHATRELEEKYPLPHLLRKHYAPMEDLSECEYFQNNITHYHAKHIKDFHNIFAYAQSQYLLRLALSILSDPSAAGTLNAKIIKIDSFIRQLVLEEEHNFKNMTFELIEQKQLEAGVLSRENRYMNRSEPLAMLQDCSLKLSARMVAVASECQTLDFIVQGFQDRQHDAVNVQQVAQNMRTIESALSVCYEDFQRLNLVFNKFIKKDQQVESVLSEENKSLVSTEEEEEKHSIKDPQEDSLQFDDFFAYYDNGPMDQPLNDEQGAENEILNFEKRITKGKFKPVLEQLKDRIEPIRKDMQEKERDILKAKGIDVDAFMAEIERISTRTKPDTKKYVDKYENERRNMLEQNNDMPRMRLPMPPVAFPAMTGTEDVLESEC